MKTQTLDSRLDQRLREAEERLAELDRSLASPEVLSSVERMRELGQERAQLQPLVETGQSLRAALVEQEGAEALLAEAEDPESAVKQAAYENNERYQESFDR